MLLMSYIDSQTSWAVCVLKDMNETCIHQVYHRFFCFIFSNQSGIRVAPTGCRGYANNSHLMAGTKSILHFF